MKREKNPVVIDLASRRRTMREAAARKRTRSASREPLLGGRPKAGLILALVALLSIALWVLPRFL